MEAKSMADAIFKCFMVACVIDVYPTDAIALSTSEADASVYPVTFK